MIFHFALNAFPSLALRANAVYLFIVIISKHNFRGLYCPGVFSNGETPVPIPNTAVKPVSADGSETSVS